MTPDEQLEAQSGVNHIEPTDDPRWDWRLCRCENNGDYCPYCLSFYEREDDDGPRVD